MGNGIAERRHVGSAAGAAEAVGPVVSAADVRAGVVEAPHDPKYSTGWHELYDIPDWPADPLTEPHGYDRELPTETRAEYERAERQIAKRLRRERNPVMPLSGPGGVIE